LASRGGGRARVEAAVAVGERVDALDGRLVVGDHERVERRDVRDGDVVLAAAQLLDGDRERRGELLARRAAAVERGELLARLGMSRSQRRSERGAQSWRRSSSRTAPWMRVQANCSSVAPLSGS
jgi:hypothetical protein